MSSLHASLRNGLLLVVAAVLLAVLLACTPLGRATAVKDGVEIALCVAQNQNLPEPLVIAKCAVDGVTPTDIENILSKQRSITEQEAQRASCAPPAPPPPSSSASSAPAASASATSTRAPDAGIR